MKFGNGIDNLDSVESHLVGKRLGLVTNHTGVNLMLQHTADVLREKYDLRFLAGPEHGVSGVAQAGAKLEDSIDYRTGLPVVSLFRSYDNVTETVFPDVDLILFDIQDVGLRFYTYIVTLYYVMMICARRGIPLMVLDRYNPLGLLKTEGSLLNSKFSSHISKFPIPTRHAMTVGEYARYINASQKIECELQICPCVGLDRRDDFFSLSIPWVAPSPNLPTIESVLCYVGTCHLEGTNLSVGRGTTKPFEQFGAPWLRSAELCKTMNEKGFPGVIFRESDFIPTFHRFKDEVCHGLQMHITHRESFQSFRTALSLIQTIRETHEEFQFVRRKDNSTYQIDLLLGMDDFRNEYFEPDAFIEREKIKIQGFLAEIRPYYLY